MGNFKIGDKVQIEYMGVKSTGKVVIRYNNLERLNLKLKVFRIV